MPPIDPQQLLRALGPLLTETGGIKGAQEALKLASLMKDASKLVTRCVYLNILRATESEDAFSKFIDVGGWDILNTWLDVARNENNGPLLGELLEVYLRIPVTVALLKQNTAAKTIKKMQGKTEDEKIKTLSTQLVDVWMKTIRGQNTEADTDDKKKKKSKDKDSEKDKDKEPEKDKEKNPKDTRKARDEKENSNRHKNHDRDSKERDNSDSHKDKRDKDRHKDKDRSRRDKTKSDQKDSSSKLSSPSSSLSSSSNKHKDSSSVSSKKSSSDDSKTPSLPAVNTTSVVDKSKTGNTDPNKADEIRRRPKTVKQFGSRMRSTGLFEEDEEEEEPAKKPSDKIPAKRPGTEGKNDDTIEKKPRLHLNMPSFTSSGLTSTTTTTPEVLHGRIKIIPAKKAPAHEIQESNVFMDALQQSTNYASLGIKKKKKLTSPSATSTGAPTLSKNIPALNVSTATTTSSSVTSPPPQGISSNSSSSNIGESDTTDPLLSPTTVMAQKLPSVPSFYRDTLEELPETNKDDEKKDEDTDSPPELELMRPIENQAEDQMEQDTGDVQSAPEPLLDFSNAEEDMSLNNEEQKPSRPKKSVTWAKETHLEQVFYFEMDENERENVNRPKSFNDLKREEMILDRRAMESAKRFNNDTMVEVLQWKLPKVIDNAIFAVEPGCNSLEKQIQMEREQSVLCALFFNKVPDTPNEPDVELSREDEEIKMIPLEDENGSCTEYEHTYNFNDPSSLPYDPEFGALPLQNQATLGSGSGPGHPNNHHGGGPAGMGGNNSQGNMGGNGNMGHMMNNLPPAISHILNVLKQQAQETRDPIIQNLQGMLTNVLQTTNPQDSGMLVERILNALEPFMNQIPGLSNLINSAKVNGGMDLGNGNSRFMGGPPPGIGGHMGSNPRHGGLLGSAPPGFNMDGGSGGNGGNMRPPGMPPGPPPMMNNGGNNYYMGGGGGGNGGMHMGGPPPSHWRGGGGGRSRPFKRGGRGNTVCMFYSKHGNCKYGDKCQFLHPNS